MFHTGNYALRKGGQKHHIFIGDMLRKSSILYDKPRVNSTHATHIPQPQKPCEQNYCNTKVQKSIISVGMTFLLLFLLSQCNDMKQDE